MEKSRVQICVPVCVKHPDELAAALDRAAEPGDLVELRLDCLEDIPGEIASPSLDGLLNQTSVPMILTLRPAEQGGHTSIDFEARRRFWSSLDDLPESARIDIELDLVCDLMTRRTASRIDWARVICSHHDFAGVPADLDQIYLRLAATPSGILKIAVQADDATDCLPIFRLLERAQRDGRELIAIAMGQAGVMTRILGPARGSFLTYGSLDDENGTAPGQLTAKQLRDIYRVDQIDGETLVTGLIGNPVSHSLSPQIHNAAFAAAGVNAVYLPIHVSDATGFLRRMAHPGTRELDWNLRGISVTAPHKSVLMNELDWVEPAAKQIGAVNTILVKEDELHGYNTDAPGFIAPLRQKFGSLKGARCAVIGAGGGARAAMWALSNEGAQGALFARNPDKGRLVAEEFGVEYRALGTGRFDGFDIVINATPLGTLGEREGDTCATTDQLRGVRLAYDLVYNPIETRFLREARAAGCETLAGVEMLLSQAAEQFRLWIGKEPDAGVMRRAAGAGYGL
jgi:3-dehydroquinate dehydratase/shikimate dehydrogenase